MDFSELDLEYFLENIYEPAFSNNSCGMGLPDMFTLFLALRKLNPRLVIESGVWNGASTKLIRKVLPDSKIICLDPRDIPNGGFRDKSTLTTYYTGKRFVDFNELDIDEKMDNVFVFFDCHQNAATRLVQAWKKGVIHVLFNDNYPVLCGSHYTLEHMYKGDNRHGNYSEQEKQDMIKLIDIYHVFPNIYPGPIKTGEGLFPCVSFFDSLNDKYDKFKLDASKYRWNTYVRIAQ